MGSMGGTPGDTVASESVIVHETHYSDIEESKHEQAVFQQYECIIRNYV
jgi:hypothetical protein